jgi:hypothetical protein
MDDGMILLYLIARQDEQTQEIRRWERHHGINVHRRNSRSVTHVISNIGNSQ